MINEEETVLKLVKQQKNCEFSIRYALQREDSQLKNCYTVLKLIKKGSRKSVENDYGNYLLAEQIVRVEEGIELISTIYQSKKVAIPKIVEFELNSCEKLQFLPSKQTYGIQRDEWPMWHAGFYVSEPDKYRSSGNSELINPKLPYYPSIDYALINFFNIPNGSFSSFGRFCLQINDYRARISSLNIKFSKVKIAIESPELNLQNLVLKPFGTNDRKYIAFDDVSLSDNGTGEFETGIFPLDNLYIALISRIDGTKIDGKEFGTWRTMDDDSITIERPEEEIEYLSKKGEDQHLEYKLHAHDDAKKNDLIETVIAFSNADGGLILLGVSDNGELKGCSHEPDSLYNLIHDSCDPPPQEVKIEKKKIGAANIIVIEITAGVNVPYQSKRDKNFYIRHNSTDMRLERSELLDLLQTKKSIPNNNYPW